MKILQAIEQSTPPFASHRTGARANPSGRAALFAAALLAALLPLTSRGVSVTADFFQGFGLDVANNYSPSGVPTAMTDVLIDTNTTATPLSFKNGAALSMESLNLTSASNKTSYTIGLSTSSFGAGATNQTLTLGSGAAFTNPYISTATNVSDVIYVTGTTANPRTLTITGANAGVGAGIFSLALAQDSRFYVTTTGLLNVNAPISGAFSLTKGGGAGTLNLGAVNTFSGSFSASNGTTNLNVAGALGSVSSVVVVATSNGTTTTAGILATSHAGLNGTINPAASLTINTATYTGGPTPVTTTGLADLSGGTETVSSLAGAGNLVIGDNATTTMPGTFTVNGTTDSTFSGVISGSKSTGTILTKRGASTLTLSGANTFTGGINLVGGFVKVSGTETAGASGPLGASGTISFGGGSLQFSPTNSFDYSSRFSTASNQKYNLATNSQTVTLATPLTSVGGVFTKINNAGTLILTAANTYDGGTTVNGGILQISNASGTSATGSGAVTVNTLTTNTGILQGTGSINAGANLITINNGTLSPGAGVGSVGTINLASTAATGALTLASTSTLAFDITNNTTNKDLVALGGSTLALNGGTLALNLPDTTATGIDYTATTNYALFTGVSGLSGSGFATVTGYDSADYAPVFTLNGTEYDLSFTAVPEPSTLCGGLLMVGVLVWYQRRRWRTAVAAA